MKLTKQDFAQQAEYHAAEPKQFGDLHQRMQLVMSLVQRERDAISDELWHAIFDLETEVSYHKPAHPPYARRSVTIK
jgi:hypothetical protein